jgi:retinol dehydrogenase-12
VISRGSSISLQISELILRVALGASHIILGCRNTVKGQIALSEISLPADGRTKLEVWTVDLSSYDSLLAFGARARSLSRLDGFIANAGLEPQTFGCSEGVEMTLLVNVVSTVLCSMAVLPVLRSTARLYGTATLEIVGSMQHFFANPGQITCIPEGNDIIDHLSDPSKREDQMNGRYALSKLLLHLAVHRLSQRSGKGVILNIVNPGWCGTELSREKPMEGIQAFMFRRIGRTSEQGARTLVHGIASGGETHDRYLSECVVKPESVWMRSDEGTGMADRVWKELMSRYRKIAPDVAGFVQ